MREFVESLKRQYPSPVVTKERLDGWLAKGTITQQEYDYITGA